MTQSLQLLHIQESAPKKSFRSMNILEALAMLEIETAHRLTPLTLRHRHYTGKQLAAFFHNQALARIRPHALSAYQAARLQAGRQTGTVNAELNILSMLLRRAKLWHRFEATYKPLMRREPPPGRALTTEEIDRLLAVSRRTHHRQTAADALILALTTGMRATELKHLRWQDVNLLLSTLTIRHSKTPAGWRVLAINDAASKIFEARLAQAIRKDFAAPEHFVFPMKGNDPTRPVSSFYVAWNAIRLEAGVKARFHDLRHTAVTMLAEAGISDAVIRAQVGHRSQLMLNIYSHPRVQAMRKASQVLEIRRTKNEDRTDA